MELIIYRDSWRRGGCGKDASLNEKFGITSLYSVEHKVQCCLGQIACQGGIPLDAIMGQAEPNDIPTEYAAAAENVSIAFKEDEDGDEETAPYSTVCNSQLADDCMPINDDMEIDDAERERFLIAAFAEDGNHTLKFVDGIAPWFQPAV